MCGISQIGVILVALAVGYYAGGALADRYQRVAFLAALLMPAGLFTVAIPDFAGHLIEAIVMRHPADRPIPRIWQKLDPAIGSALVFLLPCFVLATLSPYMTRLAARNLAQVGKASGMVAAASTVGSIAGVVVSGLYLDRHPEPYHDFPGRRSVHIHSGSHVFVDGSLDRQSGISGVQINEGN